MYRSGLPDMTVFLLSVAKSTGIVINSGELRYLGGLDAASMGCQKTCVAFSAGLSGDRIRLDPGGGELSSGRGLLCPSFAAHGRGWSRQRLCQPVLLGRCRPGCRFFRAQAAQPLGIRVSGQGEPGTFLRAAVPVTQAGYLGLDPAFPLKRASLPGAGTTENDRAVELIYPRIL